MPVGEPAGMGSSPLLLLSCHTPWTDSSPIKKKARALSCSLRREKNETSGALGWWQEVACHPIPALCGQPASVGARGLLGVVCNDAGGRERGAGFWGIGPGSGTDRALLLWVGSVA